MSWTAETAIGACPDAVMLVLTDPEQIAVWSPVAFEVLELQGDGRRLTSGGSARVAGGLAGRDLRFDVHVHRAEDGHLALTASGARVQLDVAYAIEPLGEWSHVSARIDVGACGVLGRLVATAVEGLLAGGALSAALARLSRGIETPMTPSPVAA